MSKSELASMLQTVREVGLTLPSQAAHMLDTVEAELGHHARRDQDSCSGYFPAFSADTHLSESIRFSRLVSTLTVDELTLGFNFLRYSRQPQPVLHGLHLDTDAATAVTGPDITGQQSKAVWRLLLNMDTEQVRSVRVAPNISLEAIRCAYIDGYLAVIDGVEDTDIQTIDLSPRNSSHVSGLLFCANRVPHMGSDREAGHFVAGYGTEVLL